MPKKSLVLTEAEITEVLAGLGPDATHGNGLRAVNRAAALKIADGLEAEATALDTYVLHRDSVETLRHFAQQIRQEAGEER